MSPTKIKFYLNLISLNYLSRVEHTFQNLLPLLQRKSVPIKGIHICIKDFFPLKNTPQLLKQEGELYCYDFNNIFDIYEVVIINKAKNFTL